MSELALAFPSRRLASWRAELNDRAVVFQATHHDIDQHATVFRPLLGIFLVALAARFVFVQFSGVPMYEGEATSHVLLKAVPATVLLIIFESLAARNHMFETALVLRATALIELGGLWMQSVCALVFHAGRRFAYVDGLLAAADQRMHFDWLAYSHYIDDRPLLWTVMQVAYASIYVQVPAICVALSLSRAALRLYTLLLAQLLALSTVAFVAVFTPAVGAFIHFDGSSQVFHHAAFVSPYEVASSLEWLRGDKFGAAVQTPPLITFPSFHACCAILFVVAMWGTPILRWVAVALNVAMLASTPVLGCHYLVDLFAGVLVAIFAQTIASRVVVALRDIPHAAFSKIDIRTFPFQDGRSDVVGGGMDAMLEPNCPAAARSGGAPTLRPPFGAGTSIAFGPSGERISNSALDRTATSTSFCTVAVICASPALSVAEVFSVLIFGKVTR